MASRQIQRKLKKIRNWPTPKNAEEVRQFTSFAGYYRRFVKDFFKIAKPLTELHPNTTVKNGKKVKSSKPFVWQTDQQNAFDQLKEALMSHPVLGYPNYNTPFELHTDASAKGLGAVLYQRQNDKLRVISYASRGLKGSEKNYPAAKLEFLALKWAVTEKLHDYLYGTTFTVVTDNNPLTYALSKAKLDATGHRWLSSLAPYDFNIVYRPGKSNVDADVLSRYPDNTDEETEQVPAESIKVICARVATPPLETIAMSIDILSATEFPGEPMAQVDLREIRQQQLADSLLGFWVRAVRNRSQPDRALLNTRQDLALHKIFSSLKLIRGVLYRESEVDSEKRNVLVLPSCFIEQVLHGLHNDMGHPGKERTLSLIRDRFYWPGMTSDVDAWIGNCGRCIRRKSKTDVRAPLVNIKSKYPLEFVCIDYLTLEPSQGNICNLLVITDHFTRFAVAIPTRNQTAKTTADALYREFIVRYRIPARLHSDQGANFESQLIKELCDIMNIKKSRTTPYHAAGNGMTERFNRTLISMLGTLEGEKKKNWKQHVAPLVHAYNCIKHESTGYSPYHLLFGREPRLPVDVAFGLNREKENDVSYTEYITQLQLSIQEAFRKVQRNADKARDKQKVTYDIKARAAKLEVGDRVLVKILAFDGKHKLSDKWTEEIYTVKEHPNVDIPVYKVKRVDGEGPERVLHRNNLLHLGNALLDETEGPDTNSSVVVKDAESAEPGKSTKESAAKPTPIPRPRRKKVSTSSQQKTDVRDTVENDEETQIVVVTETTAKSAEIDKIVEEEEEEDEAIDTADSTAGTVSSPVAHTATDDEKSDSEVSTHEYPDHMVDGDAHEPDQVISESDVSDNETVNTEDDTSVQTVVGEEDMPRGGDSVETDAEASVQRTEQGPRRSGRKRQKPEWLRKGEYVMSVTNKGDILKSLLSPTTLSQFNPDTIYAIVIGVSDTI